MALAKEELTRQGRKKRSKAKAEAADVKDLGQAGEGDARMTSVWLKHKCLLGRTEHEAQEQNRLGLCL